MQRSEELYENLVAVTREYLSEPSVRAAIETALKRRGGSEPLLTEANLPEVIAEAMVGLRLFCEADRFGDLMMDLTEFCDQLSAAAAGSTDE